MEAKPTTPMMEQYLELKSQHQDEVLFFRLGDFYEMFLDDAKEVSRLLNITLTARNGIPMCGIPYHAAKNYIKRLLDEGKKIAVCEQVEMPGPNRSIAKREVVQTITPGTVVEDEFLDAASNNHLMALAITDDRISCAYCELSNGIFSMLSFEKEERFESVRALYEQLLPREIIVNEDDYFSDKTFSSTIGQMDCMVTRLPPWYFSKSQGFELLRNHAESISLKQFGIEELDIELVSAGALFRYLQDTAKTSLDHIVDFTKVDQDRHLSIDESTRKNLELLSNLQEGGANRTLFSTLDMTCTSGGARLLKSWISSPLTLMDDIIERQDRVTWFLQHESERQRIRSLLGSTRDLSRLTSRVAMRRANPQDLVAIRQSIASFIELTNEYTEYYRSLLDKHVDDAMMTSLVDLMETLLSSIREDVQGPFSPGQVILQGYDSQLDHLRELQKSGTRSLQAYVAKLKEETEIPTIKLSHNKIIGQYLEIPKTHGAKIPDWFYRKQTLVNAERYTTDGLIALETEILASGEQADTLERTIYEKILDLTSAMHVPLMRLGQFFSNIDCLQSLAHCANRNRYTKPELTETDLLHIEEGRHPVVEQFLPKGEFVANDLSMGLENERFCLITGPNMAGKSTYLRQNALIVLMAQIGSYVPATTARIGLIDKLFCRVGASDNLARGESTFLIEMQEAAFILRTATSRSLAIMDEIGRGTSTQDGMSIAYAVMRTMVEMKVKTLFATHYHELTMLDTTGMQLLTPSVAETRRNIVFLRKIQPGVANSSYGLHVAKMAGIPSHVVRQAADFQRQHFADYALKGNSPQLDLFTGDSVSQPVDLLYEPIAEQIRSYQLELSTPLDTMHFVENLKRLLDELE
jgi:DNA mismatch repair protein MutS